jgi:hypothetical protein
MISQKVTIHLLRVAPQLAVLQCCSECVHFQQNNAVWSVSMSHDDGRSKATHDVATTDGDDETVETSSSLS